MPQERLLLGGTRLSLTGALKGGLNFVLWDSWEGGGQVLPGQGNIWNKDPDLGTHTSSLKDGGSCGQEKKCVSGGGRGRGMRGDR